MEWKQEMTEKVFQQILNQIKALEPGELLRLSDAVQERLDRQPPPGKRQAFYRALCASGLVKQIKMRPSEDVAERRLVQIKGQAASQTIIEDRR